MSQTSQKLVRARGSFSKIWDSLVLSADISEIAMVRGDLVDIGRFNYTIIRFYAV